MVEWLVLSSHSCGLESPRGPGAPVSSVHIPPHVHTGPLWGTGELVMMTSALNGLSLVHPGFPELVRAVFQCGHLISDTIVQSSATSHMVPVEKGEGESMRTDSKTL